MFVAWEEAGLLGEVSHDEDERVYAPRWNVISEAAGSQNGREALWEEAVVQCSFSGHKIVSCVWSDLWKCLSGSNF